MTFNPSGWKAALAMMWRLALGLCFLLILLVCAEGIADALAGYGSDARGLAIVVFFGLYLACVIVHELGHAACAWFTGHTIHVIAVSPLCYRPQARKFSYLTRSQSGDLGGWVFATQAGDADWGKGRALFVVGGALGNFAFGGLCAAIALAANRDPLTPVAGGVALASFVAGLFNLIPIWLSRGRKNDGALLLDIMLGRKTPEPQMRMARLAALWFDGIDPADWNDALLRRIETDPVEPGMRDFRNSMIVRRHLALDDAAGALQFLQGVESQRQLSWALFADYALLTALAAHDGERAQSILDMLPVQFRKTFAYYRAKAAICALLGKSEEAKAAAAQARGAAKRARMRLDAFDARLLADMESAGRLPQAQNARKEQAA